MKKSKSRVIPNGFSREGPAFYISKELLPCNGIEFSSAPMHIFKDEKKSTQRVTRGRFEIESNGDVAYLEYALAGDILELIHTGVPKRMRGTGTGAVLVESALQWAREHKVKIDVICPYVAEYLSKHPEYSDLVLR